MKNKGLTYILLIVVGIIWYNVFFRIKGNLEEDEVQNTNSFSESLYKVKERKEFVLNASYRDPFSGIKAPVVTSNENNTSPPAPIIREPKIIPPPRIHHWPKVSFYGIVKKHNSKTPLGIINIDNMLFNLREGEVVLDGIKIKKIYRDSVLLEQGKNEKMFVRVR